MKEDKMRRVKFIDHPNVKFKSSTLGGNALKKGHGLKGNSK